jgi:hypothetical protein
MKKSSIFSGKAGYARCLLFRFLLHDQSCASGHSIAIRIVVLKSAKEKGINPTEIMGNLHKIFGEDAVRKVTKFDH